LRNRAAIIRTKVAGSNSFAGLLIEPSKVVIRETNGNALGAVIVGHEL
jgi:hypothetical protein